jgi:hypothetical protein
MSPLPGGLDDTPQDAGNIVVSSPRFKENRFAFDEWRR